MFHTNTSHHYVYKMVFAGAETAQELRTLAAFAENAGILIGCLITTFNSSFRVSDSLSGLREHLHTRGIYPTPMLRIHTYTINTQ